MPDIKISEATPAGTLLETDLVPIARVGTNAPLNATMADLAAYVTVLASTHPPAMSNLPETAGVMQEYARADHVHPTDTSRAPIDSPQFKGFPTAPTQPFHDSSDALSTTEFVVREIASVTEDIIDSPTLIGTPRAPTPGIDDDTDLIATSEYFQNQGSNQMPTMNGTSLPGVSRRWSREDHVHATDLSRAAFDEIPLPGDVTPAMDGSPSTGTSKAWSREDHRHPTDSTRYPASNPSGYQTATDVTTTLKAYALLDSPQFKGNPTAPNPTPSTDADTSIATTYFVRTGIVDGSEALPGQVGEYLSAQCMSTAAVALTSGVDTSIAVLALGAGDWDLMASIGFTMGNNNSTTLKAWINTTGGGAAPPIDQIGGNIVMPVANNTPQVIMPLVPTRVNLTGTTNMRLGATVTTSGGTISGWGKLMARRRR
jgi:hypothetical protein